MKETAAYTNRYKISTSMRLQPLLSNPVVALLIHWVAQGLFYVDRTERFFKVGFDAIITSVLTIIFVRFGTFDSLLNMAILDSVVMNLLLSFSSAFWIAHTLNFLLNCQIPAVLKNYGYVLHTFEEFESYSNGVIERANKSDCFEFVAAYGSLSRNEWSPSSDLDLRVIRRAGFWNGLRACLFVMGERSRALYHLFPLDIYILDDAQTLNKLREDEEAIIYHRGANGQIVDSVTAAQQTGTTADEQPTLIFLRGADIDSSIGQTDYRIAYYFPELGFKTILALLSRNGGRSVEDGVQKWIVATPNLPLVKGLWGNWATFWQLWNVRSDVMICNPGMYLCGAAYKFLHPNTLMILDVRSVPVEVNSIGGRFAERLFKRAVQSRHLGGLSVITDGLYEDILARYNGNSQVPSVIWKSGVDEKIFDPSFSGDEIREQYGLADSFVLLFHGSLTSTRGLKLIPEAVAKLTETGVTNVKALFLGAGSARKPLETQVADLGIEENVLFLDPVSHSEVVKYVAAADAGVDPLPDNPWWNHSSSMKVYEYLQMGKPILASDIPAHRDLSDAIILFPDGEPNALAEQIAELVALSQNERAELSQIASADGAKNSWRNRAETLAEFVHEQLAVSSSSTDSG